MICLCSEACVCNSHSGGERSNFGDDVIQNHYRMCVVALSILNYCSHTDCSKCVVLCGQSSDLYRQHAISI